jgi:hypothetical protein
MASACGKTSKKRACVTSRASLDLCEDGTRDPDEPSELLGSQMNAEMAASLRRIAFNNA